MPSSRTYPTRGPRSQFDPSVPPPASKDTGDFTQAALNFRPPAEEPHARELEEGFKVKGTKAPLPSYKCFFDDSLSIMWNSPGKRAHLAKMGFLDKQGDLVDIHVKRRGYAMAERDIKQTHTRESERRRDAERQRKKAEVLALREEVTRLRLQEVAESRALRRAQRAGALGHSHSTGSLPAIAG